MKFKKGVWRKVLPLAALLFAAAFPSPGLAGESDVSAANAGAGFTWVAQERNRPLWSKVRKAFRKELSPDAPAPRTVVLGHKYVSRIGVHGDFVLVLIGGREHESAPPELDSISVYSFDVRTSRKSRVDPGHGFLAWTFVALARFDRSPAPDVLFTQVDCVECEPDTLLSSFRFDAKDRIWKLRAWPHEGAELFVGGAGREEPPHMHESVCLYAARDFNGDRLDDIAIWCRDRDVIRGSENDNVFLYSVQGDAPERTAPEGSLLKTIQGELCGGTPDSPLCLPVMKIGDGGTDRRR